MSIKAVEVEGIHYSSISECARSYNMGPKLVGLRLSRGWTINEALEITPRTKGAPHRGQSIIVKINGVNKRYLTIKDAAIDFNLDPSTVRARLAVLGWSLEEALGIKKRAKRKASNAKKVEFTFKGLIYSFDSVTQAANSMGFSEFLVFTRLNKRGWTIEQALELSPPPEHSKSCYGYIYLITNIKNGKEYVGQTLTSIHNRLKSHIISALKYKPKNLNSLGYALNMYGTENFIIKEIDTGESIDELNKLERYWIKKLVSIYPNGYNLNRGGSGMSRGQPIKVNGAKYLSISDVAREHNLNERLVSNRLRYGWTIEQSIGLAEAPDSQKFVGKKILIKDKGVSIEFLSISVLAKHYNLPYARVMKRLIKLQWSPEAAVGLISPPKWCHPMHKFEVLVDGKILTFESKVNAAKHFGFERWETVRKRLKRGWNIEQALNLTPAPVNKFASKKIVVDINGRFIEYSTQTEAAEAHGVCFKKVSARIKLGWSYEKALNIIP